MLTVGLVLVAALSTAFSLVLAKPGLARMDAAAYALTRLCAAAFLVLVYGALTSTLRWPGASVVGVAVLAGFTDLFIGFALYFYGISRIPAHVGGSLTNTASLWGVIAAVLLLRERPEVSMFVAVTLVVTGAFLLSTRSHGKERSLCLSVPGILAVLGAGAAAGLGGTVLAKYCLTHGMTPASLQLVQFLTAAICWSVAAAARGKLASQHFPWSGVSNALATSATGMFGGLLLWYFALQRTSASIVSSLGGSVTLFVFLISMGIMKESPSRRAVLGGILMIAGVVAASLRA